MKKIFASAICLLLFCFLPSCSYIANRYDLVHSKRAEEYAVDIEDYEEGSAKFHAFCNGFDAGWDQHSEEHNEEIKQSFEGEYSTGLCDGYSQGYTDAMEGKQSQYELFEYMWIDYLYDNIGYRSGYEIGYAIGYRDCKAGVPYDTSFDY